MAEVIVPSRFDKLVNNDGTPTTLFSAYLESLTDNNNDNIDIVEPYYRSLAALAALRAEVEDLKIIHSVSLIPVDDVLQKRIDDLQEELIGFVMGLVNQKDLTGFLRNVVEDATPQLGGNLDTQSFTVDGRDVGTDGTKLDGIESGATQDQTPVEIKVAYESNADTNAFTDANVTTLSNALQNIVEDTTPQLGGELDAQNVKIINVVTPTIDNDVAIKVYVDDGDALLFPLAGGTVTGVYNGTNLTQSTSITTGSIITTGGIGCGKSITIGGNCESNIIIVSDVPGGVDNQVLQIDRPDTSTTRIRVFRTSGAVGFQDLRFEAQVNLVFFAGSSERMRINSSGNVVLTGNVKVSNTAATISSGSGTPEGIVTADPGSIFMRTNGGANTSFYVKETGIGNTGWVAK